MRGAREERRHDGAIPGPDGARAERHAVELVERGVKAGPVKYPFFAPRGEFRLADPDGYVLMVAHT